MLLTCFHMSQASDDDPALVSQVRALRFAQRELVRELGITRGFERELGATLVQCHALIEVELADGLTPGELGEKLRIEQSTASRLVDRLKDAGWVATTLDGEDARRKRVTLTAEGRAQVQRGHARANSEAAAALSLIDPRARDVVVRGLQLYAKALARKRRLDGVTIRALRRADCAAMSAVVLSTLTEFRVIGRPNAVYDADLEDLTEFYRPPQGAYFVAKENGAVLGGAGIAALPWVPGACELRKMYLKREARGLGLGRLLLDRCLGAAVAVGYRTCYLNTLSRMSEAIRLYESAGFRPCPAPATGDASGSGCDRWYRLELAASDGAATPAAR